MQTKPQLCLPHPCTKTMLRFWKVHSYFHFHSCKVGQEAGCVEIPHEAVWSGWVSSTLLQSSCRTKPRLLFVSGFGGGAFPRSWNLHPALTSLTEKLNLHCGWQTKVLVYGGKGQNKISQNNFRVEAEVSCITFCSHWNWGKFCPYLQREQKWASW